MTTAILLESLVAYTKQVLKDFHYIGEDGREREIYVKSGFLKEREVQDDPSLFERYVLIRAIKGDVLEDVSHATVRFIIGAKDVDTEEGWITVMNLLEHIKQSILKTYAIDGRFSYDRNMKWEMDEYEAYPYYFAWLEVTFNVGSTYGYEEIINCI